MEMVISRFDVVLISLDPTEGSEISKTRPCVIISPDEMNQYLNTIIVAPMTTKGRDYPTRIPILFNGKSGQIVLDQIRTIDKKRLKKPLGKLSTIQAKQTMQTLQELFAW